ncbi:MAG: hypothetical protein M1821_003506 [Bathelium mastoideum]|nr:MAG: hypothetical protein M1821_003506 [Bathelium mastoideum]
MATAPIASTVNGLLHPPTDAESLELYDPPTPTAATINALLLTHPLAQRLRADPRYTESRPHMKIPAAARPHNLTAGALVSDSCVPAPPLSFAEAGGKSLVSLQYLGPGLCGHPGIVHGGMLATMLDEGLARCCFPALPNKVGVTASLNIVYLKPCRAGQVVVLRAKTVKVEGRKAWVEGWIETVGEVGEEEEEVDGVKVRKVGEGEMLCSAEALFIEPKSAATMPRVYSTQ